ncbi:hypothetical protein Tco_0161992 [Tanacetum coccineum]
MGGRRSKQDIINTVGTMGLKGIETSWNNSTAQEYESTAGANLSTAEVYESTAHSLFKLSFTGVTFYWAQCLIIENEDFVKRLWSAYTLGKRRVLDFDYVKEQWKSHGATEVCMMFDLLGCQGAACYQSTAAVCESTASVIRYLRTHGKTVITHSLTVGSSRNFERRKEGFWIRLCKGNNESRMVQTELYADVRITWIVNGAAFAVRSSIVISKGFKFVLPSFVILIDISRVLSRIKDVSSFLGRYCARILKVLVEAKSSTAEVYESTAHSLFKVLNAHIHYHLKELRYCAQCLIIENEDFVKRLWSAYTLGEPTEFEIQEMVNILVSGEAYFYISTAQVILSIYASLEGILSIGRLD